MKIIRAMNNAPSLLPRLAQTQLARALASFPVVVVTGARQTGKSTLVRAVGAAEPRSYRSLDDLEVLELARRNPDSLVGGAEHLTLDEVQRSPDLLLAIKRAVDRDRSPGRFLLTGSANLLLSRRVAESLAGRAVYLTLWPLTRREQLGLGRAGVWGELFTRAAADWPQVLKGQVAAPEDWRALAQRGGYPVPAHQLRDPSARLLWFIGYTQTYLERDLRDIGEVGSIIDFRRLMQALCLRAGSLVNQSELARDVGLSQPTIGRHLGLLEMSYQLARLPAYAVNRTKRLIKAPKIYWADTGLALSLSGEPEPRGAHLENLVLSDLLAWQASELGIPQLLYWRTAKGEEVDFVIEWNGRLLPVEIKASRRPTTKDAHSILAFREDYGAAALPGLVLYDGEQIEGLADGVLAVPWWKVI